MPYRPQAPPPVRKLRTSSSTYAGSLHSEEPVRPVRMVMGVLDLSLSEFERQGYAIEARVPWLEETLWFVPRPEQVATLMKEGISRGRIWTAAELTDLLSIPGLGSNEIESIGRLKAEFGAEILSVTPEVREAGDA